MKVPKAAVGAAERAALESGAVVHLRADEARYRLTGTGALTCLQGLVTCDLARAADGTRLFGSLLTAKGMIVTPLWIARLATDHLIVEAPRSAAAALAEVFARSLPPRLCRAEPVSEGTVGVGLYGPGAGSTLAPPPGALAAVVRGAAGFDAVLARGTAEAVVAGLERAGAVRASHALIESCRIAAGIPALGAEIDERTLPQEVRLEELGGVSYTKGCYLGQETVARVHFRGHPNRRLALLLLDAEPGEPPLDLRAEGRSVGRLTSAAWNAELDAWIAQAVIRREVGDGAELTTVDGLTALVRLDRWPRTP